MQELLASHGLMALERYNPSQLVPQQVLDMALKAAEQRRTQPWPMFYPVYTRPYQTRKFRRNVKDLKALSESVLPSRAIRLIRNAVSSLDYGVQLKKILRKDKALHGKVSPLIDQCLKVFDNPNARDDDLQSFTGQIVEDILCFDAGCWEYVEDPQFVPNNTLLGLEVVPGYSVAENLKWNGDPKVPRWVQVFDDGSTGEELLDRDIEYLSMRKRSWTPFGLSPLETVVDIMDAWLGITSYQRRVASDAYPPILINIGPNYPETELQRLRSFWDNEIKGRGTPMLLSGDKEMGVHDLKPGGDTLLMLNYQEMLVRTISYAFDLKPLDFSIERDVNRTTAEVQRISSLREGPKSIARQIQAKMNQRVMPRLGQLLKAPDLVAKLEFFWLNIDPADDLQQAQVYEILTNQEILMPDEARAELDYEQRPDGLGMMSVNALKEYYTVYPDASLRHGTPQDGNQPVPVPRQVDMQKNEGPTLTQDVAAELIRDLKAANADLARRFEQFIQTRGAETAPDVHHHNVTVNAPPINVELPSINMPQPQITVAPPTVHLEPQVEVPMVQGVNKRIERDEQGRISRIVEESVSRPGEAIVTKTVRRNADGEIESVYTED